jgi:hypothetical protein
MAFEEHTGDFDDPDPDPGFEPEEAEEINPEEREALQQDLLDVQSLKNVLALRGIRGICVWCPDCEEDHFLGWDLLVGNLRQILSSGRPPVHEPAWEPNPDEYVTWDYARGFLDGYESYVDDLGSDEACAFCGSKLPEGGYDWAYCPSCGRDLAPVNLIFELKRMGWPSQQISEVLSRAGFEAPIFDLDAIEEVKIPGEDKPDKPKPGGGKPGGGKKAGPEEGK